MLECELYKYKWYKELKNKAINWFKNFIDRIIRIKFPNQTFRLIKLWNMWRKIFIIELKTFL